MEKLKQHIESHHHGSQQEYATNHGINKQQVNEWIKHGGYYMHENKLFLIRKDFNKGTAALIQKTTKN